MEKYFIQHNQYFNELGVPRKPYFRIYEKKKFMGLVPYKKYVSETIIGMGDSYTTPIDFKSEETAEEFIRTILCVGIKREETNRFTFKVIECTKN